MGCGPDVGRLIALADQLIQQHHPPTQPTKGHMEHTATVDDLWARVVRLYEEGWIDEVTFNRFRALADRGVLRPVDVAVLQYETQRRAQQRRPSREEKTLRQLRARRARLVTVQQRSQETLARLMAHLQTLEHRIAAKEAAARDALPDNEAEARRYLEEKVALTAARDKLRQQIQALEADLTTLEDVILQIDTQMAALDAALHRVEVHRVAHEQVGT